jgi:predicted DNA-binding protein with PD1-like motif
VIHSRRFEPGPIHLLRLERGADIVGELTDYATRHGIHAAWFTFLGAVSRAALRYYDQEAFEYRDFSVDEHLEVLSGVGNVSLRDGAPFVHTHAAFGDASGRALGGHLNAGCIVFSLEVRLEELAGEAPERLSDATTGLSLWALDDPPVAVPPRNHS